MQNEPVYPYVLDPKLTTQVWGGDELVRIYGKHGDPKARWASRGSAGTPIPSPMAR